MRPVLKRSFFIFGISFLFLFVQLGVDLIYDSAFSSVAFADKKNKDNDKDDDKSELKGNKQLRTAVSNLQDEVAALQSEVNELKQLLSGISRDGDALLFTGMNLQVVNGAGTTSGPGNGKGNFTVGYNELRYGPNARGGSHNILVGSELNYPDFGRIMFNVPAPTSP